MREVQQWCDVPGRIIGPGSYTTQKGVFCRRPRQSLPYVNPSRLLFIFW